MTSRTNKYPTQCRKQQPGLADIFILPLENRKDFLNSSVFCLDFVGSNFISVEYCGEGDPV